jgi:hypothetical protein
MERLGFKVNQLKNQRDFQQVNVFNLKIHKK